MNEILTILEKVVLELNKVGARYALAGGLAANIYRPFPRVTMDIDFAFLTKDEPGRTAHEILENLGYEANALRQAQLDGGPLFAIKNKSTPFTVVVGRRPGKEDELGVDFLLPNMPWVPEAIDRAQTNLRDVGLKNPIPVITVEDLLIAKLIAYQNRNTRAKDHQDLKVILEAKHPIDNEYFIKKLSECSVIIPADLQQHFDYTVLRAARKHKRPKR